MFEDEMRLLTVFREVSFCLFVTSNVFYIEINLQVIPNIDCIYIIPIFHLGFQQSFSIDTIVSLEMNHFIAFYILIPLFYALPH